MRSILSLAALLALAGNALAQSWSDDFNRANGPIGGNWSALSGTWAVVSNQGAHTATTTNSLLQHTVATGGYASTIAELDVFSNAGTASYFAGVLIGLGGTDAIMVKIQDQSTTVVGFSNIGIYRRTSATAWGAWTGTGTGFGALSAPFVSGRIRVFFPNPDTIQVDIDTDFNGTADQTYTKTGVLTFAANLGQLHGICAWNTTALFDNWSVSAAPQAPVNNACANASVLNYGTTIGTTILATNDGASNCDPTGNDVWYAYTAPSVGGELSITSCGSAIDTVVSMYDACGGNLITCNDDGATCSPTASSISLQVAAAQQYRLRVSDKGSSGQFVLNTSFRAFPPCGGTALTTTFAGGNGGNLGGQVFFDLNITRPSGLTFSQIDINAGEPVGSTFSVQMYTTPSAYLGSEFNQAAWTLVGTATGILNGANQPSIANFSAPLYLASGSYGVALVADASWGFDYTTGAAITQYSNADLTLTAGAALNVPWTGTATFTPRLFNGSLRYDCIGAPPTAYCTAGTTTNGCTATISASGTPSASASSGFTLSIANVEGQKQGLIFYGISGRQAVQWGVGSSFLCVKSPTQRLSTQSSGGSVSACNGSLSADWLAFLAANPTSLGVPFAAGTACQVQGWFRDPPAPKSTSLSDALEFTLVP
ncbi:MAG: hypothetical protein FJ294_14670 [Planctomycetes bacterium]|nr:hypothetical protein [Planctomycetota bacterium]